IHVPVGCAPHGLRRVMRSMGKTRFVVRLIRACHFRGRRVGGSMPLAWARASPCAVSPGTVNTTRSFHPSNPPDAPQTPRARRRDSFVGPDAWTWHPCCGIKEYLCRTCALQGPETRSKWRLAEPSFALKKNAWD